MRLLKEADQNGDYLMAMDIQDELRCVQEEVHVHMARADVAKRARLEKLRGLLEKVIGKCDLGKTALFQDDLWLSQEQIDGMRDERM